MLHFKKELLNLYLINSLTAIILLLLDHLKCFLVLNLTIPLIAFRIQPLRALIHYFLASFDLDLILYYLMAILFYLSLEFLLHSNFIEFNQIQFINSSSKLHHYSNNCNNLQLHLLAY